ncbi:MAG: hypothetical protein F4X94_01395 [Dehalococcoidia bacterium]|nr:hypothetical protein [Dehalococcoidia bacterium]
MFDYTSAQHAGSLYIFEYEGYRIPNTPADIANTLILPKTSGGTWPPVADGAPGTWQEFTFALKTSNAGTYTARFHAKSGKTVNDVLTYGYWMHTKADDSIEMGTQTLPGTFDFDSNFRATAGYYLRYDEENDVDVYATTDSLTGTASYTGKATGLYAVDSDGGEFTAQVTLTATFSTEDGSTDTVSGRVREFRDPQNSELGRRFAIMKLHEATIHSNGTVFPEGAISWAFDAREPDESNGHWRATPFNLKNDAETVLPVGWVGQFSASHGTTARVIGAFGVDQDTN